MLEITRQVLLFIFSPWFIHWFHTFRRKETTASANRQWDPLRCINTAVYYPGKTPNRATFCWLWWSHWWWSRSRISWSSGNRNRIGCKEFSCVLNMVILRGKTIFRAWHNWYWLSLLDRLNVWGVRVASYLCVYVSEWASVPNVNWCYCKDVW